MNVKEILDSIGAWPFVTVKTSHGEVTLDMEAFQASAHRKIRIGEYLLQRTDDGSYWLNKPEGQYSGEGMQTSEEKLIALLDKFWADEF